MEIDAGSTVTSKIVLKRGEMELGTATGLFVQRNGRTYLITNWHVVTGRHFDTAALDSKLALPDRLTFTVRLPGNSGQEFPVPLLLYADAERARTPTIRSGWSMPHTVTTSTSSRFP